MTDQPIELEEIENQNEGQARAEIEGQAQNQQHEAAEAEQQQTAGEEQEPEEAEEEWDEDEEFDDADYKPDFISAAVENPPVLPGEKDVFLALFESYEYDFVPDHRPKTDREYFLTLQATLASVELMRYDHMKAAILHSRQRPCVEAAYRRVAKAPSTKQEMAELHRSAQEAAMKYSTEPTYRREFAAKLKKAGLTANAVEADAFLRCLPELAVVERLITSTERRLDKILQTLKVVYALRHPEQPMKRSCAMDRKYKRGYGTESEDD